MVDETLLQYISAQRTAGHDEGSIRRVLLDAGWPPSDVENALIAHSAKADKLEAAQTIEKNKKSPAHKHVLMVSAILFVLLAIAATIYLFFILN